MIRNLLLLFLLILSLSIKAQEFSFSVYNESNGIEHPYIYNIEQNSEGFLCFTTSEGAYLFDGINFKRLDYKKDIKAPFFKSILLTSKNTVYLGSNSGGIYKYVDGELTLRIKTKENTSPVISIIEKNKKVYAFFSNGEIREIQEDKKSVKYNLEEGHLYTCFESYKNDFVVAYESGFKLVKLIDGKAVVVKDVNVNDDAVESVSVGIGNLFLGTGNSGLYAYNSEKGLRKIQLGEEIDNGNIKAICFDKLNSIWISVYGVGVFEIKRNSQTSAFYRRSELDVSKGLPSEYISEIFIDRESNMWFGSLGKGLIKLNSNFLVQYNLDKYGLGSYVYSIAGENRQYCGMENGIVVIDPIIDTTYLWEFNKQLPKDKIKAIAFDKRTKTLYVGTRNNGIYYLKHGDRKLLQYYLSEDNLSKSIRHLNIVNNKMYVSTLNGLFQLDLVTGEKRLFSAEDGMPHNTINSTYLKTDGKLLIATASSGIFYLKDNKIQEAKTSQSLGLLDILAFEEDRMGGIWMATNGQGLLHLMNDNLTQLNTESGLFSNFIYQLSLDKKNTLWCGHNGGLSRVNMNEKVVQRFDKRNKIEMEFILNAANTDVENNIWFGTDKGVVQFSLFHDKFNSEEIKPIVISVFLNDKFLKETDRIFLPQGRSKLRITFRAISLSNPGEVFYQFRLKNSEDKWSSPSLDNYAEYSGLSDGQFIFEVRSRIGNGEWTKPYALAEINVKRPMWKEWWFALSFMAVLIGLIALVVNFRTLALKRQKAELENKLAIRTKEIEKQKDQIKAQFKETQDSINYGVRIQKSLLPDEHVLREIMPDSFIFMQPKDKVSGDFYYFEKFDNRVIVSAADATGHGVPGAFISLIGFVTLKEIVNRKEVDSPASMLTILDHEINKTLHQYNDVGDGKDGMDMAICEINLDTLQLKMASALRPIWIFRDGEFEKVRSSKSTIGGGMDGVGAPPKEFDLEERQMKKGDTIYMFSDGYVDQFGSLLNKKLMSKRFLNLLKEYNHLPMTEQGIIISKFLNDWKGDYEQTDDILVIGMRV
jgi:ligand-binding sensor domain-containing protein/serine phosphatase RsbU (regulator of sigma subunit)|tara:strand:+ start:6160 stop:9282 length:3123 start_codon:yes stop_codon:yes gene_type:complete